MHTVDDHYDAYDERTVTARKAHRCAACGEAIQPGHRYTAVHIVFDGSAETIKRCVRCQAIHEHLRDTNLNCDAWPDERLNCGESYREVFGEDPPEKIAALAFWQPGDPAPQPSPEPR